MKNKLISVIIPCQNGTNYVKEAIDSIKKQNMNTEVIVIDDGSTDNTAEFAKNCGATVYSIPHSGLSAARNVGLKNMKGDFVVFLDHDDVMADGTLKILYDTLQQHSDIDYVQANVQDFISPELSETDKKTLAPRKEPYGGLLTGAFLFRKEVFDKIGGFKEDLVTGQGVEFLLRANQAGIKNLKLDMIAAHRRFHNNNMGRTLQKQEQKDYAALLRMKIRGGGAKPARSKRFAHFAHANYRAKSLPHTTEQLRKAA